MDAHRPDPPGRDEEAPVVTREIAAEAALWVARLHGPDRSRQMELDCLAWQSSSPAHRHAFERCTETWLDIPSITVAGAFSAAERVARAKSGAGQASENTPSAAHGGAGAEPGSGLDDRRGGGVRGGGLKLLGWAVVGALGAALAIWQTWAGDPSYSTGVGGFQALVLDDGTRVALNTDTQVRVDFSKARRAVVLERGEALFDVAKDAHRPFVVQAAGSEVVALGTVFTVRLAESGVAVTLVEGRVSLRPMAHPERATPAADLQIQPGERARLLSQGDQVVAELDRPRLDSLLAWQRSEVLFDGSTLAEAAAEMNRYSRVPIVLSEELQGAQWRISGQYRAGDNLGFARAAAAVHGLQLRELDGKLALQR